MRRALRRQQPKTSLPPTVQRQLQEIRGTLPDRQDLGKGRNRVTLRHLQVRTANHGHGDSLGCPVARAPASQRTGGLTLPSSARRWGARAQHDSISRAWRVFPAFKPDVRRSRPGSTPTHVASGCPTSDAGKSSRATEHPQPAVMPQDPHEKDRSTPVRRSSQTRPNTPPIPASVDTGGSTRRPVRRRCPREAPIRQTFPFEHPRHKPPQALAALKSRIRKYLKRERRKSLPEGVDFWDFDCRMGPTEDDAAPVHVSDILSGLDTLVAEGRTHVYVEILAKPGHRAPHGAPTS